MIDIKGITNTIIQGDCLEVMKQMPDDCVDLVLTDPPYKITSRGGYTSAGGMMLDKSVRSGKVFSNNDISINDYLPELHRILKEGSHCYIMTNNKNITDFLIAVKSSDFHFTKNLIWLKDNKIMSQAYMSQFEYVLFLRKGAFKKINKCGTSDVLSYANPKGKSHPSEKPVGLMKSLIANSSSKADVVLDPFIGTGSVAVACNTVNRDYIGIEISKEYCEIARKRVQEAKDSMGLFK